MVNNDGADLRGRRIIRAIRPPIENPLVVIDNDGADLIGRRIFRAIRPPIASPPIANNDGAGLRVRGIIRDIRPPIASPPTTPTAGVRGRRIVRAIRPPIENPIDVELDRRQYEQERQRRRNRRKKDRQKMGVATGSASINVIELLDDDDDEEETPVNNNNGNNNNVIDLLSSKPAAVPRVQVSSPVKDEEIEILDGPPPGSQKRRAAISASTAFITAVDGQSPNMLRVLEIFPDADVEYVRKKLREQNNNIEIVVAVLSENNKYPRQKKESLHGTTLQSLTNNSGTIIRGLKSSEPKHDYSSSSASFEISRDYRTQVFNMLLYDFCFIKKNGLLALLKQHNWRYTLTRNHIHDMIIGKSPNDPPAAAAAAGSAASAKQEQTENEHYRLLRSILVRGSLSKEVFQRMGNHYCLKKPRRKIGLVAPPITDAVLSDEHFFYEEKFQQWLKRVQNKLKGQAANQMALQNGTAVQCGCCFDDVAVSECVPCKERGHLFCKTCIVQYVESQVFGSGNLGIDKETKKPALEIKCCEGSGCNSGFREELLQKVLPPKTWEKYSEMQAKAQIEQAGLGGNLAMCPKCGYQAEVPETQNIFECPVDSCRFSSCRKCGKASHIPLRCEEVTHQNRQDEGRLKIEEALSEAKMRTCPKCSKRFIKSDGCNKMTCACGMKMCYVCRKPLDKKNPYGHFCQVPHCDHSSCGKCRLYSNDAEDDAQAMREAGIAAKAAFEQKIQIEDSDGVKKLRLNVDNIMADPFQPPAANRPLVLPLVQPMQPVRRVMRARRPQPHNPN